MAFPFPTISSNSGSLNSGSYFLQNDLDTFVDVPFQEYYFGNSEQDIVEFSVYDIEGNINIWKYLPVSTTYTVLNKTYKDVDNTTLNYSYKQYNSSYTIAFNKNVLLNTLQDFSGSNINSGNHVASYNFIRNTAGNPDYQLYIKDISPSRREIKLTPSFKLDLTKEENILVNLQYQAFARKAVLVRDTIPLFNYFLDSYQIYKNSDSLIKNNKTIFALLRTNFGFKSDADILAFLDDTYGGFNRPFINSQNGQLIQNSFEGAKNYIKDWLYTYYKSIYSFEQIKTQFKYIVQKSISIRLNQINSYYTSNIELTTQVENFIIDLFFTNFISNVVDTVQTYHDNKLYAYLKNALNFGNDTFYTILNYTFVEEDGNTNIIVKLFNEFRPYSLLITFLNSKNIFDRSNDLSDIILKSSDNREKTEEVFFNKLKRECDEEISPNYSIILTVVGQKSIIDIFYTYITSNRGAQITNERHLQLTNEFLEEVNTMFVFIEDGSSKLFGKNENNAWNGRYVENV